MKPKPNKTKRPKPVRCSALVRLWSSIKLPADQGARTCLIAMRAGLIEHGYELTGFDNRFTRWIWQKVIFLWPGESDRMYKFLTSLIRRNRVNEIWRKDPDKVITEKRDDD